MSVSGRPKKDDSKNTKINVRLSEEDVAMLDYLVDVYGVNRSEVIRKCLEVQYLLRTNEY